jgi:hypothetical protein
MINSEPGPRDVATADAAVDRIIRSGAAGAIALAGLATAIVVAIWFVFYLFVFVPRATPL